MENTLTFPVLRVIHTYRVTNGLRRDNFEKYHNFLTSRIARVRFAMSGKVRRHLSHYELQQQKKARKKGRKTSRGPRPSIPSLPDPANISLRGLDVAFMLAERAYAEAMVLRTVSDREDTPIHVAGALRRRYLARLTRAASFAARAAACTAGCDARTAAEATAYAAYMAGAAAFERGRWLDALMSLARARAGLTSLAGTEVQAASVAELGGHAAYFLSEIEPLLSYCHFQLVSTGAATDAELNAVTAAAAAAAAAAAPAAAAAAQTEVSADADTGRFSECPTSTGPVTLLINGRSVTITSLTVPDTRDIVNTLDQEALTLLQAHGAAVSAVRRGQLAREATGACKTKFTARSYACLASIAGQTLAPRALATATATAYANAHAAHHGATAAPDVATLAAELVSQAADKGADLAGSLPPLLLLPAALYVSTVALSAPAGETSVLAPFLHSGPVVAALGAAPALPAPASTGVLAEVPTAVWPMPPRPVWVDAAELMIGQAESTGALQSVGRLVGRFIRRK